MKENEKRIGHLYVCTVVIPELGSDRIYEGIYSINDRLNVWIDCRVGSYEDYRTLYDLCAKNDFFTVNVSGPLGIHTGLNCLCNSPVSPVNYIESETSMILNKPNPGEVFLELYCNFWLEGKMVTSMNNDKLWRVIGVSFPNSYYWFRCLSSGIKKCIETDIGILEFGFNKSSSNSILGKMIYDCYGYVKIELPEYCSCEEAIDYAVMIQTLVRFVSGIPFSMKDIVLAPNEILETKIILHGNYGIRENDSVSEKSFFQMRHSLSDLSEEGVRNWVSWWKKGESMAILTFEKNRNKDLYFRIVDGIKCFDGISSSLVSTNILYEKTEFQNWRNSLLEYINQDNNPLNISLDRIKGVLDNLRYKSLKTRVKEFLENNLKEFPKVNSENINDVVNYLCGLRNIDSHKKANHELENKTKLKLFELERIATKIVYLIVDKYILFP